jgi:hypothetical protein
VTYSKQSFEGATQNPWFCYDWAQPVPMGELITLKWIRTYLALFVLFFFF